MKKVKYIITVAACAALVFSLFIAHILLPDKEISTSERRKLKQVPELTAETVFSEKYSGDLEEYLLDQFPGREVFRSIKAHMCFAVFQQLDNNDVFIVDGIASKLNYPLDENQVQLCARKVNDITERYLSGMDIYYSIIPDKNYFIAEQNGYINIDYDRLISIMNENMPGQYIDIFGCLDIDDFYKTDTHWIQSHIFPVAETITEAMGTGGLIAPEESYKQETIHPFYGVYCGQSALNLEPDTLVYLTNEDTENSVVKCEELPENTPVYDLSRSKGMDAYDIFLSGAQSIIYIENPNAASGRELIIFRDSFSSSLTPLLLHAYSKITLVDTRYVASNILDEYIDFADQDVLFLYNVSLICASSVMK